MLEIWMTIVGTSMALCGIPQMIRIIKRKSSADISIVMWLFIIHGAAWWLYYGTQINSASIIISNIICVSMNLFVLILIIKYRLEGCVNGKRPDC